MAVAIQDETRRRERGSAKGRLSSFARGVRLGMEGLVAKELRARSRGWRPAILLTAYLGLMAGAVAGFLALATRGGSPPPNVGVQLFSTLVLVLILLLAFITPSLTAGTISGERERRTLDLLLVTRSSPLGLAAGKLAGSLVYVLFLMAASLPAFALVYLFGGVPLQYPLLAFVVAITTAITHSSIGLLLSSIFKRTALATALTYFVVIALVFGIPFVSVLTGVAGAQQAGPAGFGGLPTGTGTSVPLSSLKGSTIIYGRPPAAYVSASPLTALAFILPGGSIGGSTGGGMLLGDILRVGFTAGSSFGSPLRSGIGGRVTYITGVSALSNGEVEVVEGWSPWASYILIGLAITIVSLLGSALALAPIKPWRTWRMRRRVPKQEPT